LKELTFGYYDIPPTICLVAGAIYAFKFSKLNSSERLIAVILFMNIVADTAAYFLIHGEMGYQYIYNLLLPLERIIALVVYAKNENTKRAKSIYGLGMAVIMAVYIVGYFSVDLFTEFHYVSNTITALILTALSYLHLRTISSRKVESSRIVILFTAATFMYSALTVSAMSAASFGAQIDFNFFNINLYAYSLWSIILIIAILWNKKT
jgi:hypothetical protein